MLDPLSLKYFSVVAREQSVNRAARVLRTSQPALSRRIRRLEVELGGPLFERQSTGVSLTSAGRALLRYCDEIRRLTDEAKSVVSQYAGSGGTHCLRIGFNEPSAVVLALLLRRLQHEHPEIEVLPREDVPAAMLEALREDEIDLALPGYTGPEQRNEFDGLKIASAAMAYVLPANHLFALRKRIRLQKLKDESFIVLAEQEHPGRASLVLEFCRQAGFVPRVVASTRTMAEAVALVVAGRGITMLPEWGIATPLAAAIRIIRCEARAEWHALWSRHNGNPHLRTAVRLLQNSDHANILIGKSAKRAERVEDRG